jgi:hypothetical protein
MGGCRAALRQVEGGQYVGGSAWLMPDRRPSTSSAGLQHCVRTTQSPSPGSPRRTRLERPWVGAIGILCVATLGSQRVELWYTAHTVTHGT